MSKKSRQPGGRSATPFDGLIAEIVQATGRSFDRVYTAVFARANEIAAERKNYDVQFLLGYLQQEKELFIRSLGAEKEKIPRRAGETPYDDIIRDIAQTLGVDFFEIKKKVFQFLQTVVERTQKVDTKYLREILEEKKAEMSETWQHEITQEREEKKRRHAENRQNAERRRRNV